MKILVLLHSLNRYVLLVLLLTVIYKSFAGWQKKSSFEKADDKLSLFLFISTHTQLLLGLILFFTSNVVIFSGESMKNHVLRYWLAEHSLGMLIAIVLISVGRISSKKLSEGPAKHKRLFIYNLIALIVIIAVISQGDRGFFHVTM